MQTLRKESNDGRRAGGEADHPRKAVSQVLNLASEGGDVLIQFAAQFQSTRTRICERHATGRADKQNHPEASLELRHAAAQCRLGNMFDLGCALDGALASNGQE